MLLLFEKVWIQNWMTFEFDPAKSEVNRRKHGIDFIAAQALWRDPALLEIPARTTDEPRFRPPLTSRGGAAV